MRRKIIVKSRRIRKPKENIYFWDYVPDELTNKPHKDFTDTELRDMCRRILMDIQNDTVKVRPYRR